MLGGGVSSVVSTGIDVPLDTMLEGGVLSVVSTSIDVPLDTRLGGGVLSVVSSGIDVPLELEFKPDKAVLVGINPDAKVSFSGSCVTTVLFVCVLDCSVDAFGSSIAPFCLNNALMVRACCLNCSVFRSCSAIVSKVSSSLENAASDIFFPLAITLATVFSSFAPPFLVICLF